MNTEILGVITMYVVMVLLAIPLGKYIAKVYSGERTLSESERGLVNSLRRKLSEPRNTG